MVFLESAGRPDVIAGSDVEAAAGLTQILASTGIDLLGMEIDVARSRALTEKTASASERGDEAEYRRPGPRARGGRRALRPGGGAGRRPGAT